MTPTQQMIDRFLSWKLPDDFSPDAGISFKKVYNEASPFGPSTHEPTGTNLLSAEQARQMLEHVLGTSEEAPAAAGAAQAVALDCYDAGLLNDFGGGNIEWWQDYIRAELGRAHDFYESQVLAATPAPEAAKALRDLLDAHYQGRFVALNAASAGYCGALLSAGEDALKAAQPFSSQGCEGAVTESVAKAIYAQWADMPGYKPWADGGNSLRQDDARRIALAALSTAKSVEHGATDGGTGE